MYARKLYYEHFTPAFLLHNNLCEFPALIEHKFKRWFCTPKPFLRFLVYKNKSDSDLVWQTQIKKIKVENSLHTQHEFLILNNHFLHSPNQIWVKYILPEQTRSKSWSIAKCTFWCKYIHIVLLYVHLKRNVILYIVSMSKLTLSDKQIYNLYLKDRKIFYLI